MMRERLGAIRPSAPAITGATRQVSRRRSACVAVAALLAILSGVPVSAPVAAQDTTTGSDVEVRIVARKLANGRVEFGLQQRQADDSWGQRQLPRVRFFPPTASVNRWLASSALNLPVGEVRIVARKLESGRIEFGLQQRQADDSWGERRLPRVRFFPTTARVNRWLASSPLSVTAAPTGDADNGAGAGGRPQQSGGSRATVPATGYTSITAGNAHSCALRTDGNVDCWGTNHCGEADPPAGRFRAVSAGGGQSCGLRSDGTITCWGYNHDGEADPPAGRFTAVSAGLGHSCGVHTNGTIEC